MLKVSRDTKIASSLLAKAFIAARAGDEEKAGSYMMAACRTDALDPVMHGIAASMGMEDDDYDDMEASDCEDGECCASDEDCYDDVCASDDDDDDSDDADDADDDTEQVDFSEVEFDDDGDVEETDVDVTASADDDEVEKTSNRKVAVPAACYRLARARY